MSQHNLFENTCDERLRQAWSTVQQRLKEEIAPQWYGRFIQPITPLMMDGESVVLSAPGRFVHDWVKGKYLRKFERMLSDELGGPIRLELKSELIDRREVVVDQPIASCQPTTPNDGPRFHPNDRFRFETFVVGQSNRMAVAGAKAVAAEPGKKFNPLFIYGPSGLGKTHLLHAIANELARAHPAVRPVYISAQQFAEEFIHALQNGRIEQFRRSQRNVGVWLVDDIQFVAGKDKTQEEVFHTFNYLYQSGKQIVLSSDRPPRELLMMDERLRSRFESGLVADVQMPDTETRCAILLSKASQESVALPDDVAMFLAQNVPGNIRVLEGALTKLTVQASVDDLPLSVELAKEMVDSYYNSTILAKPSFDQIVQAVSKHFQISKEDILGSSRKAPIVHARHVAIYITRVITNDSWKHIGTQFGDRDHTSMMHGYTKIGEMMLKDRDLSNRVQALVNNLYPEA